MRKLLLAIKLIFLTACTSMRYSYYPSNYKNDKISISASLVEPYDNEKSPLNSIWIYNLKNYKANREKEPYYNINFLSPTIKIISADKEYIVETKPNSDHIYVYMQNIILTDNEFIADIGKIQLDTGEIIDIPPLYFKKHIYVRKYNGFMDALDKSISKDIFKGTVEEYKKGEWKKKNK